MSDLEPITRDEVAWSNGDLEPITRKEKYIKHLYDETQEIPDPPQTREEWFIKKAGEEIHDVTIEPLTATDNGTYSESGKAYSPVTVALPLGSKSVTANGTYNASDDSLEGYSSVSVDVPLPENAYLKKDLPTGAIATVTDAEAEVMPSLKIAITPVQSGSGDPSPTNIRPITGWTECNVVVSPTTDAQDGTTYTITFPSEAGTVYGGTLDVESGLLTVTDKITVFDGSESEWGVFASGKIMAISGVDVFDVPYAENVKCNTYIKDVNRDDTMIMASTNKDYSFCTRTTDGFNKRLYIKDTRFINDIEGFKTWISQNNLQFCQPLATPLTYQLSPTAIKTLKDTNNISADTGDILDGEYWSKNPLTVTRATLNTLRDAGEITEITPEEPEGNDER